MRDRSILGGHLAALFTIILWGTTFISTKILLRQFDPIEILVFRFILGFVALLLAYPHRLKFHSLRRELLFAGAGLCGVTLYFLCENIALTYTQAANVGVIISVAPFFTAILASRFLDGERLHALFFVGFLCAMVGITLISFGGSFQLQLSPVGDLLALLAAVVWAIYSILVRKIGQLGVHVIQATRRTFGYGLLLMIPALFFLPFQLRLERFLEPVNLANILFLGLGASAACFVTWNFAVGRLGAIKTSLYIYLVPVVTILCSVLILHEEVTTVTVAGTVLTLAGLFLSERPPAGRRARAASKA